MLVNGYMVDGLNPILGNRDVTGSNPVVPIAILIRREVLQRVTHRVAF
nr:MAG TPA: hypothetical protein [Caudoviricetes sp.]